MRLALLAEAEVELDEAATWYDDRSEGLGDEFISVAREAMLLIADSAERDRNWDAAPDRNDLKDLFFLGVALPYSDFVVTEKAWGHISRASKVSTHYGTEVVSMEALPQMLETHGCYAPASSNGGQGFP